MKNTLERQLSNGTWIDEDRIEEFVEMATRFHGIDAEGQICYAHQQQSIRNLTRDEAIAALESGNELKWDSDWYASIRMKREPVTTKHPEPEMVKCACGHTIPRALVMRASMGTSCPDCYDRMSN